MHILEMKNNTQMLLIQDASDYSLIETEILLSLRPILETWRGQKLSRNHVLYGIRRYLRGAYFMSHVDRLPTHIISAILQVSFPIIKGAHRGKNQPVPLWGIKDFCYKVPKICPDFFWGAAKKKPVQWHGGTG